MAGNQDFLTKPRPVNLRLTTMKFPMTAIVSILHRVSGLILFLFLPFLLWVFSLSLSSAESFATVQSYFQDTSIKFLVWVFLSGLVYHLFAGIRHLIMNFGIGESLKGGRIGATIVIALAAIIAIILGIWLW